MSDRLDRELQQRFAAFGEASAVQTSPPGVAALRRKRVRRQAAQAIGLSLAAAVTLGLTFLPSTGTPSVGPAVATAAPSISPGTTPAIGPSPRGIAPSAPATRPTSGAAETPTRTKGTCSLNSVPMSRMIAGGPDTYSLTDALLAVCPDIVVHISRAAYAGSGSTLTRVDETTRTLTPTHPTASVPSVNASAGPCQTVLVVTAIGSSMPARITNLVPQLAASGSDESTAQYFAERGADVIDTSWQQPTC